VNERIGEKVLHFRRHRTEGWSGRSIAEAPPALSAGPVLDRPLRRVSILFEGSTLLRWGLPMPPEDSSCLLAVYHSYGKTTI